MGRKTLDLLNKRFGYLVVDSFYMTLGKNSHWLCKCDCGNYTTVRGQHLLSGSIQSCGCQHYNRSHVNKKEDLKGRKFGFLVVLEYDKKDNQGNTMWKCQCRCGVVKSVRAFNLKNGSIISCGCYMRELNSLNNKTHGLSYTKEYSAHQQRKRRELERKLDTEWNMELDQLLRRTYFTCVLCGSAQSLEVDHLLPLSKGNGLYPGNAIILCKSCNRIKSNKNLTEIEYDKCMKLIQAADNFYYVCIQNGLK